MDPRFDDLAGKYRDEAFKKRYAFLYDEQLPQEKAEVKKQVKVSATTKHLRVPHKPQGYYKCCNSP